MTQLNKPTQTAHFVLPNLGISDTRYNRLSFGQQLDYLPAIREFKDKAKNTHFGAKGISFAEALKRWKKLFNPTHYYCVCKDSDTWKDDSIEVWYLQ